MPQHYIKIEIKGDERNLPEKAGEYYAFFKGSRKIELCPYDNNSKFPFERNEMWVRNFDWYFLPVPKHQQPESADLKQYITNLLYYAYSHERDDSKFDEWVEAEIDHIDGFFASQSHNNTVVGPSDNDLEKESNNAIMNHLTDNNGEFIQSTIGADDKRIWWIKGAKYVLSQCKAIDLKQIEKQLLDRLGSTDGVVNTENQVKIFSFIDWLKSPENK